MTQNKDYPEKKKRQPRKITERYLYNSGLYYLQRYTASRAHFVTVMTRKIDRSCRAHEDQDREKCLEMLEKVVPQFEELGFINDEVYAKGMVVSLRKRGLSSKMIEMRLMAKGLKKDHIKQTLEEHDTSSCDGHHPEIVAGLRLIRKKKLGHFRTKPRSEGEEGQKESQKELAKMARNGFSYDIAKRVLNMDEEEIYQILSEID